MLILFFAFCFVLQVCLIAAFMLGTFFTQTLKPLINRKPFNCRPCLTFWLSLVLGGGASFGFVHWTQATPNYWQIAICVFLILLGAFVNFLATKQNITIKQ